MAFRPHGLHYYTGLGDIGLYVMSVTSPGEGIENIQDSDPFTMTRCYRVALLGPGRAGTAVSARVGHGVEESI